MPENYPDIVPTMPFGGDTNIYQQSPMMSDQITADIMQQQRIENIISQIDPERLLTDIEHRIRRMRKDFHTGGWVKIDKNQPEVSAVMISNLVSYLSAFLTNNITFSNFSEDEINRIMHLVVHDLIQDQIQNARLYDLEGDYSERDRITNIVCASVFGALKRALKGAEAYRFWRAVSISGDVNSSPDQQQKRKWSEYLKFW
jgi:hypothetical protein